jgi:hypothetical protein
MTYAIRVSERMSLMSLPLDCHQSRSRSPMSVSDWRVRAKASSSENVVTLAARVAMIWSTRMREVLERDAREVPTNEQLQLTKDVADVFNLANHPAASVWGVQSILDDLGEGFGDFRTRCDKTNHAGCDTQWVGHCPISGSAREALSKADSASVSLVRRKLRSDSQMRGNLFKTDS